MANADAFAMQRSDLNGFLFADVGVEANGMTLSVLSTLARLGMDPWEEAGRLARQPRSAAADGLARMIAALPSSLWPLPESNAIAARLVALLPARGAAVAAAGLVQAAPVTTLRRQMMELLPRPGNAPAGRAAAQKQTGPSIIVLVLLAGLLSGLTLYLVGRQSTDQDQAIPAEIHPGVASGRSAAPAEAAKPTPGAIGKGI